MVIKFRNKKQIALTETINIIKLTKEEYEIIDSATEDNEITIDGTLVKKIIAYGEVKSKNISLFDVIRRYIPFTVINNKDKKDKTHSYKCFAGRTGENTNVILHEDVGSSFNCLMSVLNNPEYALVYN